MKRLHSFALFFIMLSSVSAFAQPFERQVEPFAVVAGGAQIALPFAGGVNSPQHQFVDIDADNDLDLFVFDIDQAVDFYRNEGTRFAPMYKLRNGLISLPHFLVWFLFVDYDGDGRIDLCTEDSMYTGLRVYRNTGTGQSPEFTQFISTLQDTANNEVFTGGNSIPAFADIDADGDLDLFSANIIGSVNFYKNVGTRSLPRYTYVSGSWQNITIFGDTCTTSAAARAPNNLHGAAAYHLADIDGDGDLDFFVGDLFWTELFMLRNTGTPQDPRMECFTSHFPQGDPLASAGFNQTSFVDMDGDGDLDMFAAVLGGIVQRDGFRFYRNQGTPSSQNLRLVTKNYLSILDVGMNAHPAFVDIDDDDDLDMFVGTINGELAFFRNIGSVNAPSFSLADSAYLSIANGFYFSPAFVDIENDGDKDLFAGMYDGRIRFFRNTGTPQVAQFVQQPFLNDTIDVLNSAVPVFVDIDTDGDQDLFVGRKGGTIRYYRNDGSAADFIPTLITQTYGGISLGPDTYITPTFSDYDSDGDVDLFFGAQDGRIEFYENTGSPVNPLFIRRTDRFGNTAPTQESYPAFADIDGDGDQDLFVGNRKGGIQFYRNNRIATYAPSDRRPRQTSLAQNYPNPFNPQTVIAFELLHSSHVSLSIYDVIGREIAALINKPLQRGSYSATWDAGNFVSGVYFYKLRTDHFTDVKKMLLVR